MNTVIVGDSFAGVTAALELARKSTRKITLVVNDFAIPHPDAFARVLSSSMSGQLMDIRQAFTSYPHVAVVQDTLKSIDPERRLAVGHKKSYSYNPLVLALNASYDFFDNKHANDTRLSTYRQLETLRTHIEQELLADKHLDKTYTVIGDDVMSVAMAGVLAAHISEFTHTHMVQRAKIAVQLVSEAPSILPDMSATARRRTAGRLKRLGIQLHTNSKISPNRDDFVTINQQKTHLSSVIWAERTALNAFYTEHLQYFDVSGQKVRVNPYCEAYRDIYVVGSAIHETCIPLPEEVDDGKYIAAHLLRKSDGRPIVEYRTRRHTRRVITDAHWAYLEKLGMYVDGQPAMTAYKRSINRLLMGLNLSTSHNTKKPDI